MSAAVGALGMLRGKNYAPRNSTGQNLLRTPSCLNTLTTHTPLIKGVEIHPFIKGADCSKPLVLYCF